MKILFSSHLSPLTGEYVTPMVLTIQKVLPQTTDPAKGKVLARKFVPLRNLNKMLKWGKIADELVRLSLELAG